MPACGWCLRDQRLIIYSASLGWAPLGGQTCQKKSVVGDETVWMCFVLLPPPRFKVLLPDAKIMNARSCHSYTTWPWPSLLPVFAFLFSTELMMRCVEVVEIRTPFYEIADFSQESRLQTNPTIRRKWRGYVYIYVLTRSLYTLQHKEGFF